MPSADHFMKKNPTFTILLNSYFGMGKTLQAHSFPKCYTLSVDPQGLETLRQPKNKKFFNNLVWYEELNRETKQDLKTLFQEGAKSTERSSLFGCLEHVKEMAAAGDVETLVIDGGSYLVDLVWAKINELEEQRSANTGQPDGMAMYRSLGLYLQRLFATNLLTLSTRHNLNCIVTFHLKRENETQMQGSAKQAKKLILNSDVSLMIEGGFRSKIEGLFGGSLYLEKTLKDGKIEYAALCDVANAYGSRVMAKNRWGLPTRLVLNEKSLYEALMEALALKPANVPTATTKATSAIGNAPVMQPKS